MPEPKSESEYADFVARLKCYGGYYPHAADAIESLERRLAEVTAELIDGHGVWRNAIEPMKAELATLRARLEVTDEKIELVEQALTDLVADHVVPGDAARVAIEAFLKDAK